MRKIKMTKEQMNKLKVIIYDNLKYDFCPPDRDQYIISDKGVREIIEYVYKVAKGEKE